MIVKSRTSDQVFWRFWSNESIKFTTRIHDIAWSSISCSNNLCVFVCTLIDKLSPPVSPTLYLSPRAQQHDCFDWRSSLQFSVSVVQSRWRIFYLMLTPCVPLTLSQWVHFQGWVPPWQPLTPFFTNPVPEFDNPWPRKDFDKNTTLIF